MMGYSIGSILIFSILVILCLAIDLMAHKQDKDVSIKSAIAWTIFWVFVSLLFAVYIYSTHGLEDATA